MVDFICSGGLFVAIGLVILVAVILFVGSESNDKRAI